VYKELKCLYTLVKSCGKLMRYSLNSGLGIIFILKFGIMHFFKQKNLLGEGKEAKPKRGNTASCQGPGTRIWNMGKNAAQRISHNLPSLLLCALSSFADNLSLLLQAYQFPQSFSPPSQFLPGFVPTGGIVETSEFGKLDIGQTKFPI
jgi:hypothetical protein